MAIIYQNQVAKLAQFHTVTNALHYGVKNVRTDTTLIATLDAPNAAMNALLVTEIRNNVPNVNLVIMNIMSVAKKFFIVESVTQNALAVLTQMYANYVQLDTTYREQVV